MGANDCKCRCMATKKSLTSAIRHIKEGLRANGRFACPTTSPACMDYVFSSDQDYMKSVDHRPSTSPHECLVRTSQFMAELDIWGTDKCMYAQKLVNMLYENDGPLGLRTEGNGHHVIWATNQESVLDDEVINACVLKCLQGFHVTLTGDRYPNIHEALVNSKSPVQYMSTLSSCSANRIPKILGCGIVDALTILRVHRHLLDEKCKFDIPETTSNLLNYLEPKDAASFEHETMNEFIEVVDELKHNLNIQPRKIQFVVDASRPISPMVIKHAALATLLNSLETQRPTLHLLNNTVTRVHPSVESFAKIVARDFSFQVVADKSSDIDGALIMNSRDRHLLKAVPRVVVMLVDNDPIRLVVQHVKESPHENNKICLRYSSKRLVRCSAQKDELDTPI